PGQRAVDGPVPRAPGTTSPSRFACPPPGTVVPAHADAMVTSAMALSVYTATRAPRPLPSVIHPPASLRPDISHKTTLRRHNRERLTGGAPFKPRLAPAHEECSAWLRD